LRRPAVFVTAVIAACLAAWGAFHPPLRPDPASVDPAVRRELGRTGFNATRRVRTVRFDTVESIAGTDERLSAVQELAAVDHLLTEKRTRRTAPRYADEASGLYVGPLAVVRFYRVRTPFLADLLPYHFWSTSRITEFLVEESTGFPGTPGGRLRARITYEDRYPDGGLMQTERRGLQCDVATLVRAASIAAGLSGMAARIVCRENLQPDGRKLSASNPGTLEQGGVSYVHWYVLDNGWSIPLEGESALRVGESHETRRWGNRVVSFESDGA
jgi:hypothetical protein